MHTETTQAENDNCDWTLLFTLVLGAMHMCSMAQWIRWLVSEGQLYSGQAGAGWSSTVPRSSLLSMLQEVVTREEKLPHTTCEHHTLQAGALSSVLAGLSRADSCRSAVALPKQGDPKSLQMMNSFTANNVTLWCCFLQTSSREGCTSGGVCVPCITRMPGESYCRWLRSSLLCSCDVFQALINSLACWPSRRLTKNRGFWIIWELHFM